MRKRLLPFWLIVGAALIGASAAHAAGSWTVTRISGHVYVTGSGPDPVSLTLGATLSPGQVLAADASGRALLTHGTATMTVSPRTIIALPQDDGGAFTKILEDSGEVEFDVDHQRTPHFMVETPYLAAVVKGTHFGVRTSKKGAEVSVLRGRVEVDALATGQKTFVVAGQTATVNRAGILSVTGSGTLPPIRQGKPRAPDDGGGLPVQLRADSGGGIGLTAGPASVGVSSSGVAASVGTVASVSAGTGGVQAGALGGTVSVGVGQGGVHANVGGLGVSVGLH